MYAYSKEGTATSSMQVEVYDCPRCDETFPADDYEARSGWYHSSDAIIDGHDGSGDEHCSYVYTDGPGTEEAIWLCGNGCLHHDEGTGPVTRFEEDEEESGTTIWVCGKCEREYPVTDFTSEETAERAAVQCCQGS